VIGVTVRQEKVVNLTDSTVLEKLQQGIARPGIYDSNVVVGL